MIVVVAYDVNTEKAAGRRRLRRVARACKDYGQRVQKSVFECRLDETTWTRLRHRLLEELKEDEDSLRFYFIDASSAKKTEHYGLGLPADMEGPLIA
ncbi:MAG: CRISPR-associated endonuclease Cas2 [Elusimicrobia bacterium]|nr:CRISPR-associated endonuclease Cas2 [Elusimicrobiota bacterium]